METEAVRKKSYDGNYHTVAPANIQNAMQTRSLAELVQWFETDLNLWTGEISKQLLPRGEFSKQLLPRGEISKQLLPRGEISKQLLPHGEFF